jgi:hypothetical protein
VRLLREAIDSDRFPLSPRSRSCPVKAGARARPAASLEPRVYEPPSRGGTEVGVGTGP